MFRSFLSPLSHVCQRTPPTFFQVLTACVSRSRRNTANRLRRVARQSDLNPTSYVGCRHHRNTDSSWTVYCSPLDSSSGNHSTHAYAGTCGQHNALGHCSAAISFRLSISSHLTISFSVCSPPHPESLDSCPVQYLARQLSYGFDGRCDYAD